MDGYFPSELQARYPDGVGFELHDKRHITYAESHGWLSGTEANSVFASKGYRLGSGRGGRDEPDENEDEDEEEELMVNKATNTREGADLETILTGKL